MLIGYARVSTQDQNLELQREALLRAGCEKIFEDKVSGAQSDRPSLTKAIEILRAGDTWGRLRKRNLKHVKPSRVIFSHRLVAHPLVTHACTTFVV